MVDRMNFWMIFEKMFKITQKFRIKNYNECAIFPGFLPFLENLRRGRRSQYF